MAKSDQTPHAAASNEVPPRVAHDAPDENKYLFFGQLGKPHGLRGGIFVTPFNRDTAELAPGFKFIAWNERLGSREAEVKSVSLTDKKGRTAVRLSISKSREDAEALRGDRIYIPWETMESLGDEGFYYSQMVGFEVVDPAGDAIGEVKGVFEAATDIFVVRAKGQEILIPVVKEIVLGIDTQARRICVDLPEDIAEANERPKTKSDSRDE